jgi:hypothetical protein
MWGDQATERLVKAMIPPSYRGGKTSCIQPVRDCPLRYDGKRHGLVE